MGFSLRKTGDYKQAYTFYRKALDFDPDHKGALEYLGRALCRNRAGREGAARMSSRLKKLCPGGCEELADLEQRNRAQRQGQLRLCDAVIRRWRRPRLSAASCSPRFSCTRPGASLPPIRRRLPICRLSACPGNSCRSRLRSNWAAVF